jgi:hypothetical protein
MDRISGYVGLTSWLCSDLTLNNSSRHKYLRNKHAALQNSERLNEILGIKSETASPATSGMSTPVLEEPMTSTDIFAARMQQNNTANATTNDDEPARPMFGGLGFATSSGIGSTGYNGSGLRGLGFVKATVSVMPSTIETKVEETVVVESTPAPASVESSASDESAKEDKKSKKEKKEKKDKKRKSEDSDNSRSKKSKK